MKKLFIAAIAGLSVLSLVFGQANPAPPSPAKPFPQATGYAYGFRSTKITSANADSIYTMWKKLFLVNDCGDSIWRVTSDVSSGSTLVSKSEGMGYGMIMTAYYGDKAQYDGLLHFYLSRRTDSAEGLMGWEAFCTGWMSQVSASDGDLDAAYSCIVAYNQWGGNYLKICDTILKPLEAYCIVSCGGGIEAIAQGIPNWAGGGCECTDLSYYTPAYFKLFAEVDSNPIWTKLADSTYRIRNACANATTGLVPDWQAYNGTPGGNCNGNNYYGYDACRVPWRTAIDYLWNGDTIARDYCKKVSTWANTIGAKNIVDGYSLSGNPEGQYHNSAFVGGFAVGAMCNSQAIVDSFSANMKTCNDQQYYDLSLKAMYMLVLSGNLWKPSLSKAGIIGDNRMACQESRPALAVTGHLLTISGLKNMRSAKIVTPAGKVVAAAQSLADRLQVNMTLLGRGLYIVTITLTDGRRQAVKFVRP